MSKRRKRKQLKKSRAERAAEEETKLLQIGLKRGTIIPVDSSKITSRSVLPKIPEYYRDKLFWCQDCGEEELWTAKRQQLWYEEQGGETESIAIRCRACRKIERARKEEARKVHLEGLRQRQENNG